MHQCTSADTDNLLSDSFLETHLVVNPELIEGIPLISKSTHDGKSRWSVRTGKDLEDVAFNLGSSGSLRVKDCWRRSGQQGPCFVMKFQDHKPQALRAARGFLRQLVAQSRGTQSHLEYIFTKEQYETRPILVYVCSTSPYA